MAVQWGEGKLEILWLEDESIASVQSIQNAVLQVPASHSDVLGKQL